MLLQNFGVSNIEHYCERFEPRSHFKRLSLSLSLVEFFVRVNVVLNRTVVVDSD